MQEPFKIIPEEIPSHIQEIIRRLKSDRRYLEEMAQEFNHGEPDAVLTNSRLLESLANAIHDMNELKKRVGDDLGADLGIREEDLSDVDIEISPEDLGVVPQPPDFEIRIDDLPAEPPLIEIGPEELTVPGERDDAPLDITVFSENNNQVFEPIHITDRSQVLRRARDAVTDYAAYLRDNNVAGDPPVEIIFEARTAITGSRVAAMLAARERKPQFQSAEFRAQTVVPGNARSDFDLLVQTSGKEDLVFGDLEKWAQAYIDYLEEIGSVGDPPVHVALRIYNTGSSSGQVRFYEAQIQIRPALGTSFSEMRNHIQGISSKKKA